MNVCERNWKTPSISQGLTRKTPIDETRSCQRQVCLVPSASGCVAGDSADANSWGKQFHLQALTLCNVNFWLRVKKQGFLRFINTQALKITKCKLWVWNKNLVLSCHCGSALHRLIAEGSSFSRYTPNVTLVTNTHIAMTDL